MGGTPEGFAGASTRSHLGLPVCLQPLSSGRLRCPRHEVESHPDHTRVLNRVLHLQHATVPPALRELPRKLARPFSHIPAPLNSKLLSQGLFKSAFFLCTGMLHADSSVAVQQRMDGDGLASIVSIASTMNGGACGAFCLRVVAYPCMSMH